MLMFGQPSYKDYGSDIDPDKVEDSDSGNSLLLAVRSGHLEEVEAHHVIMEKFTEDEVLRMLKVAVRRGHLDVCKYFVQFLEQLRIRTDGSATLVDYSNLRNPALYACLYGHLDIFQYLISMMESDSIEAMCFMDHHANVGSRHFRDFPLHAAASGGHTHICQFILDNGVDVNHTVVHGCTALYTAAKRGRVDVVQLLLSRRADPKIRVQVSAIATNIPNNGFGTGDSAFDVASQHGHARVVKLLLPYASSADRDRALRNALNQGNCEIARILLQVEARFGDVKPNFDHHFHQAGMTQMFAEFGFSTFDKSLTGRNFTKVALSRTEEGNLIAATELDFDILGVLAIESNFDDTTHHRTFHCLLDYGFDFDVTDHYLLHFNTRMRYVRGTSLLYGCVILRKFELFLTMFERLEATAEPNSQIRADLLTSFLNSDELFRSNELLEAGSEDRISFLLTQGADVNFGKF